VTADLGSSSLVPDRSAPGSTRARSQPPDQNGQLDIRPVGAGTWNGRALDTGSPLGYEAASDDSSFPGQPGLFLPGHSAASLPSQAHPPRAADASSSRSVTLPVRDLHWHNHDANSTLPVPAQPESGQWPASGLPVGLGVDSSSSSQPLAPLPPPGNTAALPSHGGSNGPLEGHGEVALHLKALGATAPEEEEEIHWA